MNMDNEPFITNDGGRWFVMQNIDYEDCNGNWGMSTEYLCNVHGYDNEELAEKALFMLTNNNN